MLRSLHLLHRTRVHACHASQLPQSTEMRYRRSHISLSLYLQVVQLSLYKALTRFSRLNSSEDRSYFTRNSVHKLSFTFPLTHRHLLSEMSPFQFLKIASFFLIRQVYAYIKLSKNGRLAIVVVFLNLQRDVISISAPR